LKRGRTSQLWARKHTTTEHGCVTEGGRTLLNVISSGKGALLPFCWHAEKRHTAEEGRGEMFMNTTIKARLSACNAKWDIVSEIRMVFEPGKATLDSQQRGLCILFSCLNWK